MYQKIIICLLSLFISANAFAHSAQDIDAAIHFVEETGLDKGLPKTAMSGVMLNPNYHNIVKKVGSTRALRVIREELAVSARKYQQQWNRSWAILLLGYLTPVEMQSILEKKGKSPYVQKFKNSLKDIDASGIASTRHAILHDVSQEALKKAWSKTIENKYY